MSEYLTAGGIIFILLGAWLVAFEVVAKFEGQTHGGSAPYGGIVKVEKLGIYKKWERKRNIAMWTGLACITLGSFLQLAGLFIGYPDLSVGSVDFVRLPEGIAQCWIRGFKQVVLPARRCGNRARATTNREDTAGARTRTT